MDGQSTGETLPTQDVTGSAIRAVRLLKLAELHGPKVMIYVIAAELLGVFEWISANAPGVCS